MRYLEKEEIQRAKMCVANIKDKIDSIYNEVYTVEKPDKGYLKEKIDSIIWDSNVINNMVSED